MTEQELKELYAKLSAAYQSVRAAERQVGRAAKALAPVFGRDTDVAGWLDSADSALFDTNCNLHDVLTKTLLAYKPANQE
jgi:hypothetical protein